MDAKQSLDSAACVLANILRILRRNDADGNVAVFQRLRIFRDLRKIVAQNSLLIRHAHAAVSADGQLELVLRYRFPALDIGRPWRHLRRLMLNRKQAAVQQFAVFIQELETESGLFRTRPWIIGSNLHHPVLDGQRRAAIIQADEIARLRPFRHADACKNPFIGRCRLARACIGDHTGLHICRYAALAAAVRQNCLRMNLIERRIEALAHRMRRRKVQLLRADFLVLVIKPSHIEISALIVRHDDAQVIHALRNRLTVFRQRAFGEVFGVFVIQPIKRNAVVVLASAHQDMTNRTCGRFDPGDDVCGRRVVPLQKNSPPIRFPAVDGQVEQTVLRMDLCLHANRHAYRNAVFRYILNTAGRRSTANTQEKHEAGGCTNPPVMATIRGTAEKHANRDQENEIKQHVHEFPPVASHSSMRLIRIQGAAEKNRQGCPSVPPLSFDFQIVKNSFFFLVIQSEKGVNVFVPAGLAHTSAYRLKYHFLSDDVVRAISTHKAFSD